MEVRFELISPEGKVWLEVDLDPGTDQFHKIVAGLTPLYGVLVLSGDDGTASTITDDFDAMMMDICLKSVPQLSKGLSIDYLLAARAEKVSFISNGNQVRISGDVKEELLVDRADLVTALLDCAARYVAFKEAQLGPTTSAYYRAELQRAITSAASE